MRRLALGLSLAVIAAAPLAGCGGGGDGLSDGYSVEAGLRELPYVASDKDEPVMVLSGDLEKAAKLGKLPKPTDEKKTLAWGLGLTKDPLYVPVADDLKLPFIATGSVRKLLGFDARQVRSYASVETPPTKITVMRLADCAELKKGVTATGEGKAGDLDRGADASSPFPIVQEVGHQGDRVALAQRAGLLEDWSSDGGRTMADHGALLDIAQALDAKKVHSGLLLDGARTPTRTPRGATAALKMPEFSAVGIGEAVEDGHEIEYVAYRVEDADQAKADIEKVWKDGVSFRTNAPLSDLVRVEGASTDGDVVVVKLAPKLSPGLAVQMLQSADAPFVAGG